MTDFVGKQVVVVGTSREELNGTPGIATDYLLEKGRVAVELEGGKSIAFKPANLELKGDGAIEMRATNGTIMEMHAISQEVGFRAKAEHLFNALTDEKMLSGYTQTKCKSDARVGGKFSFFEGNITGYYTELEAPNKIVMKWRNKDWHAHHYSTVTLTLEETASSVCKLTLEQVEIPDADSFGNSRQKETVESGWENFFWERIQKMVGYHKVDRADW